MLGGIFLWFLFSFINSQQSGGGNKMTDFGKSHAKMTKDGSHNVTFRDGKFTQIVVKIAAKIK